MQNMCFLALRPFQKFLPLTPPLVTYAQREVYVQLSDVMFF